MGVQHADASGQWPHLDALYTHPAIDLVAFDNYLPLSDWTTGTGGLDATNWSAPAPTTWPPSPATMNGLGLTGTPNLWDKSYLKTNIEGGEKYNWFYVDSTNQGGAPIPTGRTCRCRGQKTIVWYKTARPMPRTSNCLPISSCAGGGTINIRRSMMPATASAGRRMVRPRPGCRSPNRSSSRNSGFPSCDRATNQPNVFYDPKSSESFTPFWSIWDPAAGATYQPRRDNLLPGSRWSQWWNTGRPMATTPSVPRGCRWSSRPSWWPGTGTHGRSGFSSLSLWGDDANWPTGTWLNGKDFDVAPKPQDAPSASLVPQTFPTLTGQGWSVRYRPMFATGVAAHATGRESRAGRNAAPLWEIEMSFERLSGGIVGDIATLAGFYDAMCGAATPFFVPVPAELGLGPTLPCRFADDAIDLDEFMQQVFAAGSVTLLSVRG